MEMLKRTVKIEHVLGANSAAVENLQKMVGEMASGGGWTDEMEIESTPPRVISNSIDKSYQPRALDQQQHFNRIDWSNRPGNTPRNSRSQYLARVGKRKRCCKREAHVLALA
jgi:hypothetical protein